MTYLIDSDWVADWLQGRPDAVRLLTDLSVDGLAISLDPDILIAATAIHRDLTLLTRNLRHFQRITDLKIYGAP